MLSVTAQNHRVQTKRKRKTNLPRL
uniref:Uncharacterized protein n=1 Tax=Rhizophora mucronata TaxID=61149 RepID=A0A2P2PWW6_RHIMU